MVVIMVVMVLIMVMIGFLLMVSKLMNGLLKLYHSF